jgi:hypothetical protein
VNVGNDERLEEVRPGTARFDAAPVRATSRVPRAVLLVAVTAVLAFVAGTAVAGPAESGPTASRSAPTASPSLVAVGVAPDPTPGQSAATTGAPDPGAAVSPVAGTSAFLAGFEPEALLPAAPGERPCQVGEPRDKVVPRTRRDGPRLTFQRTWVAWCPLAEADRQAYLVDVFTALARTVPADTYGYSADGDGGGDALLPYAEPPLAGTIAVAADAAGRGLAIAIVAEEWVVTAAR